MSEQQQQSQIVQIHPDARYVLVIHRPVPGAELERLSKQLSDWWASGDKFVILSGTDMELVRTDTLLDGPTMADIKEGDLSPIAYQWMHDDDRP